MYVPPPPRAVVVVVVVVVGPPRDDEPQEDGQRSSVPGGVVGCCATLLPALTTAAASLAQAEEYNVGRHSYSRPPGDVRRCSRTDAVAVALLDEADAVPYRVKESAAVLLRLPTSLWLFRPTSSSNSLIQPMRATGGRAWCLAVAMICLMRLEWNCALILVDDS